MSAAPQPVPPGGPSTINGVLYQLLWALATLGRVRVAAPHVQSGELEKITLIVEPARGGDQQTVSGRKRVVTQLKARSTGNPWSLQDIIREVLPDLYMAVDEAELDTEFYFVTESRAGRWSDVQEFFTNLPPPASDILSHLDDTNELRFGRSQRAAGEGAKPFWELGAYSSRRLFQKIVDTLRERPSIAAEPNEVTCRKTWLLLRGFRLMGGQTQEALHRAVDECLLNRIGSVERLPQTRDALLLDLARRACAGNGEIDAERFFAENGLAGIPLTAWCALSVQARDYLAGVFRRKGVDPADDVRPTLTRKVLTDWTPKSPIVVLTGETGSGKTWHGYTALTAAAVEDAIVLLVESLGRAELDLTEAERTFWLTIAKRDEAPPLSRLRERLRLIDPANVGRDLVLLVDNVATFDEARRLVEADWESWGVRLAMTCPPFVAHALRPLLRNRGRVVQVANFTIAELQSYFRSTLELAWEDVPFGIRDTLRRPLLARIFRDVIRPGTWQPRNEYELYQRAWDRLRERGVRVFDIDGLQKLAKSVLTEGTRYPWAVEDLRCAGIDNPALDRLLTSGWLHETTSGAYEVWHDRLLNWTLAQAVVHEMRHHPESFDRYAELTTKLFRHPVASGRMLAYVPMDVLWLLSHPQEGNADHFGRLTRAFEATLEWRWSGTLFRELLPTLGERAVGCLLERLKAAAETGPSYVVTEIVDGLVATGSTTLPALGIALLADARPKVRRAGLRLLSRSPVGSALDTVWAIHAVALQDPTAYLWSHEHRSAVYTDTFGALKACVRLNPAWLEQKIGEANVTLMPLHDLGYLVANLGDARLWARCKGTLIAKIDDQHERSIATCILVFRDTSEQAWLEERVSKQTDLVGLIALQALAVINPPRALASLDELDEGHLYFSRSWGFLALYHRLPRAVMEHVAGKLRTHANPWRYALLLQGREDLIDAESFDFLLDRLADLFAAVAGSEDPRTLTPRCRCGYQFVNAVCRPDLLERLRARRGTALDEHLAGWLLAVGAANSQYKDERFDVLNALAKIGGDGFSRVLDDWLERGNWYARFHAVELALRRVTPVTIDLLTRLTRVKEPADEGQRTAMWGYAAATLASHAVWGPVFDYFLRTGMKSLMTVDERAADADPPVDFVELAPVLKEFRDAVAPSAGSVLAIGLSGRTDLLPEVRAILGRADPASDVAGASLFALRSLGDEDSATVEATARALPYHRLHATTVLLAIGSEGATSALLGEVQRSGDMELATILANRADCRAAALEVIRQRAITNAHEFAWGSAFIQFGARLSSDALRAVADIPEILEIAEELAYSPPGPVRVHGIKPGALRLLALVQPEPAFETAVARVRDSDTTDRELYVRLVGDAFPDRAVAALLELLLVDPPAGAVHCIGCQLQRLDAESVVRDWLSGGSPQKRVAACRVAGYLTPSEALRGEVSRLIDDTDKRVADAAGKALEQLRRAETVALLIRAFNAESDSTHGWVLLDALIATANPGMSGSKVPWTAAIADRLTPAMRQHLSHEIKQRRENLAKEWGKEDQK